MSQKIDAVVVRTIGIDTGKNTRHGPGSRGDHCFACDLAGLAPKGRFIATAQAVEREVGQIGKTRSTPWIAVSHKKEAPLS